MTIEMENEMTKDEIQAACDSLYALRVYARSCDDNIAWHFDTIDKLTETIRAALQSAQDKAEKVDLEDLKKEMKNAFIDDDKTGLFPTVYWCCNYIAQNYNITRKTK